MQEFIQRNRALLWILKNTMELLKNKRKQQMKIESPLSGKPRTRELIDEKGEKILKVKPRELTPLRALLIEAISKLSSAILIVLGMYYAIYPAYPDYKEMGILFGTTLVSGLVLYKITSITLSWIFRKGATILFSTNQLKIKTLFGWKIYDRRLPHKFYLLQHDKTPTGFDKQEMQTTRPSKTKKALDIRRYYEKSCHVVFEYASTRIDIMTVYKQKPASTILARFNLCDKMMDNELEGGNGLAQKPEDQWGVPVGEID